MKWVQLIFGGILFFIAYYVERSSWYLIPLFGISFGFYWYLAKQKLSLKNIILLAGGIRMLMILAPTHLSDDVYRFYWDAMVHSKGFNVFAYTPDHLVYDPEPIELTAEQRLAYEKMNSKGYYSVYPTVNQFIFRASYFIANENLIGFIRILRAFVLGFDLVAIYALFLLLGRLKIPTDRMAWYALNPLILLEGTVNLHFEILMLYFLIGGLLFYSAKVHHFFSAIWFALAVNVKLLPLMFLPLFIRSDKLLKVINFYVSVLLFTILILGISLEEPFVIFNFLESVELYFKTFEFNASIFYVVRWIGFSTVGWDIIQTAGPIMSLIVFIAIIAIGFTRSKGTSILEIIKSMNVVLTIYLLMASIVHPWYILPLIGLAVITGQHYVIIWSGLIFLSYSAYEEQGVVEKPFIILLEYAGLFLFIGCHILSSYNLLPASLEKSFVRLYPFQ